MARTPLQARPTLYKGVQMRSRMEAEFAAVLDAMLAAGSIGGWQYEPMCFASQDGQYLPDFAIDFRMPDGGLQRLYIETKPVVDDFDAIADRMEIIWASEPSAGLAVYELHGDRRGWTGDAGMWWYEPEHEDRVRIR